MFLFSAGTLALHFSSYTLDLRLPFLGIGMQEQLLHMC